MVPSPTPPNPKPPAAAPPGTRRLNLSAWRARTPGRVTGLDFDGNTLRLAQVDATGGRQRVVRLKSAPLRAAEGGPLTAEARALLNEARADRSRIVIFIPRSRVTVREVTVPSLDPGELRRMAPFEAARVVPHSADELVVDIEVVASNEDGTSAVRLFIAREDDIQSTIALLDEAGLEPDKVELSTTALARAMRSAGEQEGSVCYLGDRRLDIVMLGGGATFSRGVEVEDHNGSVDGVAGEIERSLRFAGKEAMGTAPGPVRVVSDADHAGRLAGAMPAPLGAETYRLPKRLVPDRFAGDIGPFLPAIGAALDTGPGVNLLPRSLQERRLRRLRVGQWVLVVTAGLLALALMTVLADRYLASARRELEVRQAAIAELEPHVRRVGELQAQAVAIARHLSPDSDALEVYTELHRIVPAGVSLYHVQFQFERGRLSMKGQTTGFPAVWKLLEALAASPMFADVETRYAARREVRGNQVIDFSIDAALRGGRS